MERLTIDNPYESMVAAVYSKMDDYITNVTRSMEIFSLFVSSFQKTIILKEEVNATIDTENEQTSVGTELLKALPKCVGDTSLIKQLLNDFEVHLVSRCPSAFPPSEDCW